MVLLGISRCHGEMVLMTGFLRIVYLPLFTTLNGRLVDQAFQAAKNASRQLFTRRRQEKKWENRACRLLEQAGRPHHFDGTAPEEKSRGLAEFGAIVEAGT
jgi:hypothetical protein